MRKVTMMRSFKELGVEEFFMKYGVYPIGGGDGDGGDGGAGGGDGGDGNKDTPTVESLQKAITDMNTASAASKAELETKVSGLINDLQREREKNKPKDADDDDDGDKDGDKTFLTKKQTMDVVKKMIGDSANNLASAYSEDKLVASVDKAKIKYVEKDGHIPYAEVIEKGFLEFAKKAPGLIEAMKTAQNPAEFAYTVGVSHPVFAARRRAVLSKEIAEGMNKPKPTKIKGVGGKEEISEEDAGNLSPAEWEKLPEATKRALLFGSGK